MIPPKNLDTVNDYSITTTAKAMMTTGSNSKDYDRHCTFELINNSGVGEFTRVEKNIIHGAVKHIKTLRPLK